MMTRILVIDDSMYQRNKVRRTMVEAGYELLEATNGREGLEIVATHTPDCILLDLIMPEMDGIEVLQTLHNQWEHMPVVVLTADIQESTRQQCLKLGAVAFINKPLQEAEMLQAIKQAIDDQQDETGEELEAIR
jgi:CheY-like chemotaxis protein